jgi:hypothetical protein
MEPTQPSEQNINPTWALIRDVATLQVKLVVDGLRDLVLVPASLIAGIVSLARTENGRPGPEFYKLVSVGRQSERWINLFGALENAPPGVVEETQFSGADMDEIIGRMETYVIDEYRTGGVTAQAKEQLDKALAAMRRRQERRRKTP